MWEKKRGAVRSAVRNLAGALVFAWACAIGASAAQAQGAASANETEAASRLLTVAEGRAIVSAAWETDPPTRGTQDCSHIVHQIYANAGFEYPYASSFEIYEGSESFERVRKPQSGDLVAWPGHVGIVVDPLQHSFYSLVRTGWEAQDYEGPYWKSRGRPRFFRYKVGGGGGEVLSASAARTPEPALSNGAKHAGNPTTEPRTSVGNADPNRPPRPTSERTNVSERAADPVASVEEVAKFEMPSSILIAQRNKPPTREEVAEGISEVSDAFGSVLRSDDPLSFQLPVVIVEDFKVERIEVKREHGWARLEVHSNVFIASGAAHAKNQRQKVRWELRRTESGWEAVVPADRNYVPHDVAVKSLAAQLARLTESDGAAAHEEKVLRQESRVANLLSMLLQAGEKISRPPAR
jgi:NlpC/P60 family protein